MMNKVDTSKWMVAVLTGWQNEMGHHNPNDPEYKAYQRMIEFLLKEIKEG